MRWPRSARSIVATWPRCRRFCRAGPAAVYRGQPAPDDRRQSLAECPTRHGLLLPAICPWGAMRMNSGHSFPFVRTAAERAACRGGDGNGSNSSTVNWTGSEHHRRAALPRLATSTQADGSSGWAVPCHVAADRGAPAVRLNRLGLGVKRKQDSGSSGGLSLTRINAGTRRDGTINGRNRFGRLSTIGELS